MRTLHVVLLVGLSLAVGSSLGYVKWGVSALRLSEDFDALRVEVELLKRDRDACHAGADAGQMQWEGFGVVRAVYPKFLVVTHEEFPDNLPAKTTGFRLSPTAVLEVVMAGDAIHFTLQGLAFDTAIIVEIEQW